jgi:predicted DNA-binding mobile mystery protein A
MRQFQSLILDQIDQRVARWRGAASPETPSGGWIRAIRSALGMTKSQLATRLKVQPSTVVRFERSEGAGTMSLVTLQRVAEALDCDLQYALVPRKLLRQVVLDRAHAIADRDLARVNRSMNLEVQGVEPRAAKRMRAAHVEALLNGPWRRLWR